MTLPVNGIVDTQDNRKRKTHRKSRLGCRNCKLRRVKCDEARPECKKCLSFGVACNYNPATTADLELSVGRTASIRNGPERGWVVNPTIPRPIDPTGSLLWSTSSEKYSGFNFDRSCHDRLHKFYRRTVLSIGPQEGPNLFRNVTLELAYSHPYLMHVVQTVTAAHDRILSAPAHQNSTKTTTEIYHLSRAAALLNKTLSEPIRPEDRDAVWATAALLGLAAFSWIEVSSVEEAWPLKSPEPSDLEWITMSELKSVIYDLTQPSRPDSMFHKVDVSYKAANNTSPPTLSDMPPLFLQLFELDDSSTPQNNPYLSAIKILVPLFLLNVECDRASIVRFLPFVGRMEPRFKALIESKDARALLLLAYWYAMVCKSVWWLERRANLECQATCIFLERYHGENELIQELLLFPKAKCGLLELL
ncbi:hypothetical protein G7Y89_g8614 [Cudoniella acicularis]|uniref:Zn(2)-C6 fungal-type domain-containing protein n=1 Tax=Cudoniella acicularis TaxID=354080 RepID=A0A8H4RHV1_9HELO|nr:hypothetical protein G7Y89_g8614 [Cudoniella acicularis]